MDEEHIFACCVNDHAGTEIRVGRGRECIDPLQLALRVVFGDVGVLRAINGGRDDSRTGIEVRARLEVTGDVEVILGVQGDVVGNLISESADVEAEAVQHDSLLQRFQVQVASSGVQERLTFAAESSWGKLAP